MAMLRMYWATLSRAVLDVRGVHLRSGGQDVGAFECVHSGVREVVDHGAAAHGRGVHAGEQVKGLVALLLLDAGQHPVGLQVAHRGNRHLRSRHGAGQAAPEVDAGQHVLGGRVDIADSPADPALCSNLVGLAGVPDVHGPEVRAVGVGITDALDDRHLALVVEALQGTHGRVEADVVIQTQNLLFGHAYRGSVVGVERVAEGDQGVDGIVAAG